MGVGLSGIPLLGDLPIVDEEYFQWVSLLQAVNAYVSRSESFSPRSFVVAEFGARYGTWAARGARAVRSKIPDARVDVCVVEGDPTSYKRMIAHLERNAEAQRAAGRYRYGRANQHRRVVDFLQQRVEKCDEDVQRRWLQHHDLQPGYLCRGR